jgi:hypothetical protein
MIQIIGSKFIYWDIHAPRSLIEYFEKVMKRMVTETQERSCTQEESDILEYCPIQLGNYTLSLGDNDELNVVLSTYKGYKLYGERSWIPFIAKFFTGELKVQGIDSDAKWGVKLLGDGKYVYEESISEYKEQELNTVEDIDERLRQVTRRW